MSAPTEADYRLPRTVTPARYDLEVTTDLERSAFRVTEAIEVTVHERVEEVVLNAAELEISDAWVERDGDRIEVSGVRMDPERERVYLALAVPVDPGDAVLHLTAEAGLNEHLVGYYRSTYEQDGVTHVVATSHFEATDARRAFPCWDEPDLKAVFGITLIVRDGVTALSNGAEIAREDAGDGMMRIRFEDTIPMSTYLVCFVVGRLELTDPLDVDGVPLRIAHVPGMGRLARFPLEAGAFSLRFFTDYYGIPYPNRKLDLVGLPDFAQGAMENLGLVTFRESVLMIDPDDATVDELIAGADTIAHEIAHMWFGDLVTMRWWNGLWLNEAFATFMGTMCTDAFRPEWQMWTGYRRYASHAYEVDALDSTRSIEYPVHSPHDADGMFDSLTYAKGGHVLRMLERYLGTERFRDGIRKYLTVHAYGNTETSDLWDAIEEATGEPVRAIMDSWVWQGGYPVLSARAADGGLEVEQQRFRLAGGDDGTRWKVPLLVRSLTDGQDTSVLLDGDRAHVAAAPPAIVNAGGAAFVRVRYEPDLLAAIGERLSELSDVERLNLVDDAWAAAVSGKGSTVDFLGLVKGFAGETDVSVWGSILTGLRWCDRFLDGEPRERLRAFVRDLVRPAFERMGWEPAAGERDLDRELRGELLVALAVLGQDGPTVERARDVERRARAGEPVDTPVASAALTVAATVGTPEDFDAFLAHKSAAATPQESLRYLEALAAFRDPALFARTLELCMTDEVRSQDAPFVLVRAEMNRELGGTAWSFVRDRWDELNARFAASNIIYLAYGVRSLIAPDVVDDVQAFFKTHDIPQAALQLRQALEGQIVNADLAERAAPALARALLAGDV